MFRIPQRAKATAPRLAGPVPLYYPPFRKSLSSGFVVVGIIVDSLVDVLADVLVDVLVEDLSRSGSVLVDGRAIVAFWISNSIVIGFWFGSGSDSGSGSGSGSVQIQRAQ